MTPEELSRAILAAVRETAERATLREAAQRSESGAEDYRAYLDARRLDERVALGNAQTRSDPLGTANLLVRLAFDIADGRELSPQARRYVSDALLSVAKNPSHAGAAFGLKPNRGRKSSWETARRRAEIANFMAAVAKEQGLPIRPTAHGSCAAEIAAAEYNVSVEMARNAYYEFRPYFEPGRHVPDDESGEG
jgi:hypothetical protein